MERAMTFLLLICSALFLLEVCPGARAAEGWPRPAYSLSFETQSPAPAAPGDSISVPGIRGTARQVPKGGKPLIEIARTNNREGNPVGSSYLSEASGLMQSTILPDAAQLYQVIVSQPSASFTRRVFLPGSV